MPAPAKLKDGMGSKLYPDGTCRFRVWAPFAKRVQLGGEFLPAAAPLIDLAAEGTTGNWSADVPNVKSLQRYHYEITNIGGNAQNDNSQIWRRADARALQVENSNPASSSYVIDLFEPQHQSKRPPFTTPAFENFILYQVHVGSFSGRNDVLPAPARDRTATFRDLGDKLSYIRDLGFNALALLPIGEIFGDVGLGFGTCDMFSPEDAYGTSNDKATAELIQLIDNAHTKGLAVLFDVVYSHGAINDNRYWRYDGNHGGPNGGGPYHENGHDTRFGSGFAMWRREVRDFFLDNIRWCFRDCRVDGIRFDAVQFIDPGALSQIIWQARAEFPEKYLIAEYNPRDQESASAPMDPFGQLGFHATWDLAAPTQMFDALNGNNPVGNLLSIVGDFRNPNPWCSVRYPLGSHDQIYDPDGNRFDKRFLPGRFGGRNNGFARAKTRLAWSFAAAIPGTPMLFMGTEGMLDDFWAPEDTHGDHRINWNLMGDPLGAQMQLLVRDINNLRWAHPALRSPAGNVVHVDFQGQVIAFKRYDFAGDLLLIVVNVSDNQWAFHDYGVNLGGEGGAWREIFNSQSPVYGGIDTTGNFGETLFARDGKLFVNLSRWSVAIFQKN